jgi:hypothetical protein
VRVPKNLGKPINEVGILSLPDDCEVYLETRDPVTGKLCFQVDYKTVTIVDPFLKHNIHLKQDLLV